MPALRAAKPAGATLNERGRRRAITGAVAVAALVFGGFGGWSATAPLSGAVVAPGVVKVLSSRKSVAHREGGIVDEILVADGDRVAAGDVLVRLDATQARNSYNLLRRRSDHVLASIARLEAELGGRATLAMPASAGGDPPDPDSLASQHELLAARLQMLASSEAMIDEQVAQLRSEIEGHEAQIDELTFRVRSLDSEIEGLAELQAQKLIPRTRLLERQREAASLRGDRAAVEARIGGARRAIAEAGQQRSRTRAEFHERANRELTDSQRLLHEITEQLDSAAHSLAKSEIRAPAGGIVVGLAVHTVGGVAGPGETLLEILPDGERLVVEAEIPVKTVDLVSVGQPVDIAFVSSRSRTMKKLEGTIAYVSADRAEDAETGRSYFIVRASLGEDRTLPEYAAVIQPGVAAELFIKTETRTPLRYLLEPLSRSLERAWRD